MAERKENMEQYESVEIEVIVFESDDIITASGDPIIGPYVPASLSEDTLFSDMWNEEDE